MTCIVAALVPSRGQEHVALIADLFQVRRFSRLDDPRLDGRTVPRRGLRVAGVVAREPRLHRSTGQDEVRLPHHHGRGQEVNERQKIPELLFFYRCRKEKKNIFVPHQTNFVLEFHLEL